MLTGTKLNIFFYSYRATLLGLVFSAVIGPKSMKFETGKAYQLKSAIVTVDLENVKVSL